MEISVAFGETIEETFVLTGTTFTAADRLLFTIRHMGQPLLWEVLTPTWSEVHNTYIAQLSISHADSESKLQVGQHKYGLTLYRDAVLTDGIPSSGTVDVLIASELFTVTEAEAREAGLS